MTSTSWGVRVALHTVVNLHLTDAFGRPRSPGSAWVSAIRASPPCGTRTWSRCSTSCSLTSLIWLVVPLLVGLRVLLRSEVK